MINVDLDNMTGADLARIRVELNLTHKEFSEKLQISTATFSNWVTGKFHINPSIIPRLKRLIKAQEKKRSQEEDDSVTVSGAASKSPKKPGRPKKMKDVIDVEFEEVSRTTGTSIVPVKAGRTPPFATPEGIKQLRERYGLSQGGLGLELGVGQAQVSRWERGAMEVQPTYYEGLQEMWKAAPRDEDKPQASVAITTSKPPKVPKISPKASAALSRPLPPEPLLELSSEFFERYRAERNRRDVDATLDFMSEKMEIPKDALRKVNAMFLLLLKKDMTAEEMYACLTGHTR